MTKLIGIFNSLIAIKYWPIEKYAEEFRDDLEGSIKKGYVLNDIAYFMDKKLVEFYRSNEVTIDDKNRVVKTKKKSIKYDLIVTGDAEKPRISKLLIKNSGSETEFEYRYRNNYFGVVPKELSNVFFLGYTRPSTGGLANITEMQSLFIHKLLTDDTFKARTCTHLETRAFNN
ncbi:MAG: hypothetical protein GKR87_13090 [Kiritimatiellae bacterium]|nr:hypothetical protein [Kiritimatiellia bacterium]